MAKIEGIDLSAALGEGDDAGQQALEQDWRRRLDTLPDASVRFEGFRVGDFIARTRYEDGCPVAVIVDRADPYVLMSQNVYDQADREFMRVDGDLITLGTPGEGLGKVTYRIERRNHAEGTLLLKRED